MARAHRLSGYDPDEEEDEFEELQEKLDIYSNQIFTKISLIISVLP